MKIFVKVKPNSKKERIEKVSEYEFVIWVKPPARENLANEAVIKALSDYFDTAKSNISIIRGFKDRIKAVEINEHV